MRKFCVFTNILFVVVFLWASVSCKKIPEYCNPDCGLGQTSASGSNLAKCNCVFYQFIKGKLTKKSLIKSSCSIVTDKKNACYKICKKNGGLRGSLCIDRCFCVPNKKPPSVE